MKLQQLPQLQDNSDSCIAIALHALLQAGVRVGRLDPDLAIALHTTKKHRYLFINFKDSESAEDALEKAKGKYPFAEVEWSTARKQSPEGLPQYPSPPRSLPPPPPKDPPLAGPAPSTAEDPTNIPPPPPPTLPPPPPSPGVSIA